jgi:peroxiredoxin (alkyl hydroperoxide reductase subunit C)
MARRIKMSESISKTWPNNELIGDNLIVPPAGTVEQIDLRKKQAQAGEIYCYDWRFCYKPL